ncbi:hypothetical protein ES705_03628 [subsurface metagenome]
MKKKEPKFMQELHKIRVEVKNMDVVCHNLPPESAVEGLLGLNFLKSAEAIIDFSKNIIETPK